MEYWEGFFLGKFWTDSDYHDRKHKVLFITISFSVFLLTVISLLIPEKVAGLFFLPVYLYFAFGIILLIALPFLAPYYYRLNLFLQILILLAYFIQYIFLFFGFIQAFIGRSGIDLNIFITYFADIFDQIMLLSGDLFIFLGGLGSAIASVAGGIIIGALVVLFVLLIMIFIPLLYLLFFRFIQRLVDRFVYFKQKNPVINT